MEESHKDRESWYNLSKYEYLRLIFTQYSSLDKCSGEFGNLRFTQRSR